MKRTKIKDNKLLSAVLAAGMAVSLLVGIPVKNMSEVQAAALNNPYVDRAGVTVWDCVYFGNYPQSDVTGNTKEPIKWRVLSVNGDDAFLVADAVLDKQRYNNTSVKDITWKDCTMRSWLNGYGSSSNICKTDYTGDNFIDCAFTKPEQNAIRTTTIMDVDNPFSEVGSGSKSQDKLYLLSFDELTNPEYGFSSNYGAYDNARIRRNTAYAVAGEDSNRVINSWLARSRGWDETVLSVDGNIAYLGGECTYQEGVCPALHLNLSFSKLWSYAGTVSSDGSSTKDGKEPDDQKNIMKGAYVTDSASKGIYKVTESYGYIKTVQYIAPKSRMTNVVIPNQITIDGNVYQVTSIAPKAFGNNIKVTKVTIGKHVKTIGTSAFSGCKKLKSVSMGANVTTINKRAFYKCGKLTKITIPAKVSKIGEETFFTCKQLKSITIKSTKLTSKKIGKGAFKNIYSKTTIKVPKSKLKSYKKILKLKGVSSKAKIRK